MCVNFRTFTLQKKQKNKKIGGKNVHVYFTPKNVLLGSSAQCIVLPGTHRSARHMHLSLDTSFNLLLIYHLCFICRNFMPSKILSSDIISCKFLSFTSFCQEQAKHSHYQFSCQVCMFTSFCRATTNCWGNGCSGNNISNNKEFKVRVIIGFLAHRGRGRWRILLQTGN